MSDTDWQELSPRARLLFHLQGMLSWLVLWLPLSVAAGVGLAFLLPVLWAVAAGSVVALLSFLVALWLPSFAFERWGWALREEDFAVTHGVLVRQVSAIPSSRIQHVDLRQGPVEQLFGLARVQVYTASGMGADGVVPGLELAEAEDLRDRLVRLGGDDGV